MKKLVLLTFAVASLASFTGCKKKGGNMAAAFNTYADDVCACVDKKDKAAECVKAASDKYAKENPPPKEGEKLDPSEMAAFAKETAEAQKKMTDCQTKIATAAAGAAAGGAGDMKKDDMKKDDAAKPEEKKADEPKKDEAAKPEEKKEEPKAEEKK